MFDKYLELYNKKLCSVLDFDRLCRTNMIKLCKVQVKEKAL